MSIEFTQYLLPNGRKRTVRIERPIEIEALADEIVMSNLVFETEMLMTGQISLTVSNREEDLDSEIVPNGPEVPLAVDRLVKRVYETLKKR